MATVAREVPAIDVWERIHDPDISLVVEPGDAPAGPWVDALLAIAPFAWRVSGPPDAVAGLLPDAPRPLQERVAVLASRLATLMDAPWVTVRVEGVTGNACTRMHADYTDVRLILTLAGPGTEHVGGDDPAASVQQLPAGWIGLFKGRTYPGAAPGRHAPCLHRSPAIDGTGERRLVLVIDTADSGVEPA
jgi:hypothetical protein